MAFNSKEQEIISWGLQNGKSKEEVKSAIANYRLGTVQPKPAEEISKGREAFEDFKGIGEGILEGGRKAADTLQEAQSDFESGDLSLAEQRFQTAGALAGAGANAIGETITGAAKLLLSQEAEDNLKGIVSNFGEKVAENKQVQGAVQWYSNLPEGAKRNLDAAGGLASLISEFIGVGIAKRGATPIIKGAKEGFEQAGKSVARNIDEAASAVPDITLPDSDFAQGIKQTASDLIDRVPRAIERGQEGIQQAANKARRIENASPELADAIKVGVDDRILNTIEVADTSTIADMKKMLDIADNPNPKLGRSANPAQVAGDAAAGQYDLIYKKKQEVGKAIGDKARALSKGEKVNVADAIQSLEGTLKEQGLKISSNGKINFSGTGYTPAEREMITKLYNLAREGGENLTPSQIYKKDQLFSKLQREARFEGLSNIIIDDTEGSKNLFRTFRDVYSNKLSEIDPEIKALNQEYAKLIGITSDIENSIFKSPNLNITKITNEAEFAKTNLRRLLSDAQSSEAYAAIANQMDEFSRSLGYNGANPTELIDFAAELRKLYPETIPQNSFQGGIKVGIGDVLQRVSQTGEVGFKDQQKALRNLLDALTKAQ